MKEIDARANLPVADSISPFWFFIGFVGFMAGLVWNPDIFWAVLIIAFLLSMGIYTVRGMGWCTPNSTGTPYDRTYDLHVAVRMRDYVRGGGPLAREPQVTYDREAVRAALGNRS